MKSVTVLLSTYNGEKYIREQLESLSKQSSIGNFQVLIRDDGSTDKTVEIIEAYADKYNFVKLTKGRNIGYINSFFELIKNADYSDYYALCDQDDVWNSDKLSSAIKMLQEENANIPLLYGSRCRIVDKDLNVKGETKKQTRNITLYNSLIQNIAPGHTMVFNNELRQIIINEVHDTNEVYVHDSLILNIAVIKGKFIFDNEPHDLYRQTGENYFGYANGLGWIKSRTEKLKNGEGKKYSKQVKYLYRKFYDDISDAEKQEINKFINAKNLYERVKYTSVTKLYRQSSKETFLFKLAYIFGLYSCGDGNDL